MKKALVCGAGGFIASHLVKRLKKDGYWVRGVDIKKPEYSASAADEFRLLDLRDEPNCHFAASLPHNEKFDEEHILYPAGYVMPHGGQSVAPFYADGGVRQWVSVSHFALYPEYGFSGTYSPGKKANTRFSG